MNFSLPILAPSILAADKAQLGVQVQAALDGGAQWIHCDIMDGHFVPNISFGPDVVGAVSRISDEAFMDVHLMIENPDQYVEAFCEAGANLISVHVETCVHLHRTLQLIRSHGALTGVVLNPATPVYQIEPILQEVDLVLLMSVNPGFGGQKFIPSTLKKLAKVRKLIDESGYPTRLEVDGGVGVSNIREIAAAGADMFVAGSAIFNSDDYGKTIAAMRAELGQVSGEQH
mgnify:CR=1 FL=1